MEVVNENVQVDIVLTLVVECALEGLHTAFQ